MEKRSVTEDTVRAFERALHMEERAAGTIENYLRHVRRFAAFLEDRPVDRETVVLWKEELLSHGYDPASVNAMLVALNKYFAFMGWPDCRIKALRLQKKLFREEQRELNRSEYDRLLAAAHTHGKERLALLIEAICATGVRVSEVRYLTVEAAQNRKAVISLKGKIRTILIPGKLVKKLLKYARKNKIASGEIFRTRSGKGISRKQIWAEMKALCGKAGIAASKVFPHNLRHLFARIFYKVSRDVAKLADVLGHSSIETTRIYLISTGTEHARQLERLGLIS